jgi:hypothetical protein
MKLYSILLGWRILTKPSVSPRVTAPVLSLRNHYLRFAGFIGSLKKLEGAHIFNYPPICVLDVRFQRG